ncbi:MAG: hypothetical protein HRF51_11605 [bacterium]
MKTGFLWKPMAILAVILASILLFPLILSAGDDHEEGGDLDYVVPTDNLSGLSLFLADLYNEHRLLYALIVTATMALLGILVALVTDYLLRLIGFRKVKKSL